MLPISLCPEAVPVALVGIGDKTVHRLAQLDEGGFTVIVFSDAPSPDLVLAAGSRLRRRLPNAADLGVQRLLLVADLDEARAADLAFLARQLGLLVNVEDRTALCDFHLPAIVRRGDLVVAISTGGQSPRLAGRLRRAAEKLIHRDWGARLARLGLLRTELRAQGHGPTEIARAVDAVIDREGWLGRPGA
jgi:precorrin-2 dehydrogenase/sirohydrochlorin ferrochelatase